MSRRHNARQNHNINVNNISFENVAMSKYLRMTGTRENGFMSRLRSEMLATIKFRIIFVIVCYL